MEIGICPSSRGVWLDRPAVGAHRYDDDYHYRKTKKGFDLFG